MGLAPGEVIENKYTVSRCIGRGGMGEVWEGENTRIRRRVAIKVLLASAALKPDLVTRFEREAQAAGRIGSDHILEILDLGVLANGDRYMVMEFLDGEPLSARIERVQRMDAVTALGLTYQVLEGLHAAHLAGIVHRDLKPDNIFLLREKAGRRDFVKIIDFGISKFTAGGDDGLGMTRAGAMMGTPLYMSPEQARSSAEADAGSDVYSVGVILHEMLSGRTPFRAQSFSELLFEIAVAELPRIEEFVPDIDPEVAGIVRQAMERDRRLRFASAADMAAAIERVHARLSGAPLPTVQFTQPQHGQNVSAAPHVPTPSPDPATQPSWSQSQVEPARPRSTPGAGALAVVFGVFVVVLGLGAFGASRLLRRGEDKTPAAVAASTTEVPQTKPSVSGAPLPPPTVAEDRVDTVASVSAAPSVKAAPAVVKPKKPVPKKAPDFGY